MLCCIKDDVEELQLSNTTDTLAACTCAPTHCKSLLLGLMLRRTKDDVGEQLQLPPGFRKTTLPPGTVYLSLCLQEPAAGGDAAPHQGECGGAVAAATMHSGRQDSGAGPCGAHLLPAGGCNGGRMCYDTMWSSIALTMHLSTPPCFVVVGACIVHTCRPHTPIYCDMCNN